MASQHGIIGDDNYGTDLPQTQVPEDPADPTVEQVVEFAKAPEYQRLKGAMQSRIDYWKQYTPGSDQPVRYRDLNNEERGWRGLVADVLIEEFQSIFMAYETAVEESKEKK